MNSLPIVEQLNIIKDLYLSFIFWFLYHPKSRNYNEITQSRRPQPEKSMELKKVNVLFLQDHGGIGGAQLSLLDLLTGFTTINSRVVPHVVVGEDGFLFKQLLSRGIHAEILSTPRIHKFKHTLRRRRFINRLIQICEQWKIEIIHANNHRGAPWSATIAKKTGILSCCNVRVIIDPERARRFRVVENGRIVSVSKAIQESVGLSDPAKIRTIYVGVKRPNFFAADEDLLSRLKIPKQSGKRVGFLGRLSEVKGPHFLIDAIPFVLNEFPDTIFIFIGGGEKDFVEQLRSRIEKLAVAKNIVFTGRLEFGARYLKLLDLFVVPSLREPLGRVTVEAMYAGLPVVGTDSGGTPEIIEHDRTGRLVPPCRPEPLAQEILFYLKNDRLRKEHGEVGRQRATELFDITNCARRTEELYTEMIDR